jgi:hypothetical protein
MMEMKDASLTAMLLATEVELENEREAHAKTKEDLQKASDRAAARERECQMMREQMAADTDDGEEKRLLTDIGAGVKKLVAMEEAEKEEAPAPSIPAEPVVEVLSRDKNGRISKVKLT